MRASAIHEGGSAPGAAGVWGRPVLIAVGDTAHAADLARMGATAAHNTDGMVILFTIAHGPAIDGDRTALPVALQRAAGAVDRYRVPYRIDLERRHLSEAGVERAREVAWYISDRARRWDAQLVVVGAPDGIDPRLQIHRHLTMACTVPVVPVRGSSIVDMGTPALSA